MLEHHLDRTGELAGDRFDRLYLQDAEPDGREIAGYAVDAQPVGTVGGHLEVDDRIDAEDLGRGPSALQVVGQLQNAVALLRNLQLPG